MYLVLSTGEKPGTRFTRTYCTCSFRVHPAKLPRTTALHLLLAPSPARFLPLLFSVQFAATAVFVALFSTMYIIDMSKHVSCEGHVPVYTSAFVASTWINKFSAKTCVSTQHNVRGRSYLPGEPRFV